MKRIDGATLEGGGQIVRTALFLSTLLGEPVTIDNIRAGRPKPGLKPQHVTILRILDAVSGSASEGATVGSERLVFRPGAVRGGNHRFDVGTAGSLPLVLQTLVPVALLADGPLRVELDGGTDVRGGPTIDWIREAYLPYVRPLARGIALHVERRGFEPGGGGKVRLEVEPVGSDLRRRVPLLLPRPRSAPFLAHAFEGSSVAQNRLRAADVAGRQSRGVASAFLAAGFPAPHVVEESVEATSVGSSVTLWLTDRSGRRLGSDALGARGVPAEDVGRKAAQQILEDLASGADVDRHLADFVVPWIALGAGYVTVPRVTGHLRTNMWVCNRLVGEGSVRLEGHHLVGPSWGP